MTQRIPAVRPLLQSGPQTRRHHFVRTKLPRGPAHFGSGSLIGRPSARHFLPARGIWLGRRAFSFPTLIGRILMTAWGFWSLNWFLVFRMGGERQSDRAQGGNRGVRRRVVEDAGPKLLPGNLLLSPRPLEAFCPVNCRGGGGSSSGRHAGALQGEDGVPGPEA